MAHWPESLKPETWEVVHESNLDKLIEETFGRRWSTGQNLQNGNGAVYWMEVYPDADATAKVEEWLASAPAQCPGRTNQPGFAEDVEIYTYTIVSELCNRGILPEGDMRVHSYW